MRLMRIDFCVAAALHLQHVGVAAAAAMSADGGESGYFQHNSFDFDWSPVHLSPLYFHPSWHSQSSRIQPMLM